MRAPLRRLRLLAPLAASLALFAGIVELGALLLFGEQAKFPRRVVEAPWGLRYNEPGARYRHRSADVDVAFRINARGLRDDREHAYAKPAGRLRIVSLGDSFTAGYEVEAEDTFSSVLERALGEAGRPVEVLNAGVSGFSTAEELLYLERELLRYAPDLVLVSFYGNDLVDNVRTGLFHLEEGELVAGAERYVPLGRIGNLLNTNPLANWLSSHSNAFVLMKERLTWAIKRGIQERNQRQLETAGGEGPAGDEAGAAEARGGGGGDASPDAASDDDYERRLGAALFRRMRDVTRAAGIPLVIHSIPSIVPGPRLLELFPLEHFDPAREGVLFVPAKQALAPHLGRELLYHRRSHGHWTPFAHAEAGAALAGAILEAGLLAAPEPAP